MPLKLPDLYYRVRDNGAAVFRLDTENRNRRIEMEQIAVVNVRNGEIKPHGDRTLTETDRAAIRTWLSDRQALTTRREVDDILRTVDHLNQTAHWAQTRASDDQIDAVANALLLAMHDLRSVLVRRQGDRLMKADGDQAGG